MNWYLEVWKRYADFSGRSRRKEYWMFFLGNIIISAILAIADIVTGSFNSQVGIGLLGGLFTLVALVPSIAVSVRRMHDTGRSGWWILLSLVPILGPIVVLVFLVLDSNVEANAYGESPKYVHFPLA